MCRMSAEHGKEFTDSSRQCLTTWSTHIEIVSCTHIHI